MKILMHTCCAPCSIYPLRRLRDEGLTVMGYFYRHNIHPYTECQRRQETLETFAEQKKMKLIVQEGYDLEGFLRNVVHREKDRCRHCYFDRLRSAARVARKGKFDAFTSTLLYSKFQKHDLIRDIGASVAKETGVPFHYQDFRTGWKEGIDVSKRTGMYRQDYCGCIYSEKERFFRKRPSKRPSS
ncbi:MAG: epoxyqueuosine reductase QueH [Desulfosarcina sp.]|nr:epoxyqueuosine reductase QueH [Desulfobacterales bacterium]